MILSIWAYRQNDLVKSIRYAVHVLPEKIVAESELER